MLFISTIRFPSWFCLVYLDLRKPHDTDFYLNYENVWENYSILENIFVHFTQAAEKQIQL